MLTCIPELYPYPVRNKTLIFVFQDSVGEGRGGCDDQKSLFHPVCLSAPSTAELTAVLGSLFHSNWQTDPIPAERLFLLVTAPGGARIRVLLTEQLLSTLRDQTAFKTLKNGPEVCLEVIE
jgi:hypothetical protein